MTGKQRRGLAKVLDYVWIPWTFLAISNASLAFDGSDWRRAALSLAAALMAVVEWWKPRGWITQSEAYEHKRALLFLILSADGETELRKLRDQLKKENGESNGRGEVPDAKSAQGQVGLGENEGLRNGAPAGRTAQRSTENPARGRSGA